MNGVFLDTVGLLAVWDKADQWHPAATRAYAKLLATAAPLTTTSFIFLECGNAAARRPYRKRVNVIRQAMEAERAMVDPTPEDLASAWAAYDRGEAGEAGIADHISFAVMRRLGITQAFTNDQHFEAAGFEILF